MKKGILASYIAGITDVVNGEAYSTIMKYLVPEFVTALLLYSVPVWLDAHFISHLRSTPMYAALGTTNNLLHLIIKIAEAFCVGTIVISGTFNGMGEYKQAGRLLRDAFWLTCLLGIITASFLYCGAYWIYWWYGVAPEVALLGIPFLRMRAIGVLFTFVFFAFVGFLRGIKNAKVPMQIFAIGSCIFIFFDYVLIFGKWGFPAFGLQGSAIASVISYASMACFAAAYIFLHKDIRRYGIQLLSVAFDDISHIKQLLVVSWPVVLDKAILALAYIWLCKMITPMGTCAVATFCVVKDMERFAFLPALAGAQVITFLVSNDIGAQNWIGVKTNVKKILFITSLLVCSILAFFSCFSYYVVRVFDQTGNFTVLVTQIFPLLSVLVIFDLVQLILSGALRGAGNVKMVMKVRLMICLGYFIPMSYLLAHIPVQGDILKFVLVYGAFYIGNALMSIMYINYFRNNEWKSQS